MDFLCSSFLSFFSPGCWRKLLLALGGVVSSLVPCYPGRLLSPGAAGYLQTRDLGWLMAVAEVMPRPQQDVSGRAWWPAKILLRALYSPTAEEGREGGVEGEPDTQCYRWGSYFIIFLRHMEVNEGACPFPLWEFAVEQWCPTFLFSELDDSMGLILHAWGQGPIWPILDIVVVVCAGSGLATLALAPCTQDWAPPSALSPTHAGLGPSALAPSMPYC